MGKASVDVQAKACCELVVSFSELANLAIVVTHLVVSGQGEKARGARCFGHLHRRVIDLSLN